MKKSAILSTLCLFLSQIPLRIQAEIKPIPNSPSFIIPGPVQEILPQRFEIAAYLNCGPEMTTTQNGITIACLNGNALHSANIGSSHSEASLTYHFSEEALNYSVTGLESQTDYNIGFTWCDIGRLGRKQTISINDEEVLPETATLAYEKQKGQGTPTRIQFALLPKHIKNGSCQISIRETGPANAINSELWIMKRIKPKAVKQILLISGQDYRDHLWRKTQSTVEKCLVEDQRLEVTICENPYILGLQHLNTYDALFIHFKNYASDLPSTKLMQQKLEAYIHNGGGMCLSHFACGAFQEWPDFVKLSGRIWDGGAHDKLGQFTVKIKDPTHPITSGLSDFVTDDELYYCLKGEPEIHVLCEATSKNKKADFPQAYIFMPGKGRVFLSTLGHYVRSYEAKEVQQLYRQAAAWASGL